MDKEEEEYLGGTVNLEEKDPGGLARKRRTTTVALAWSRMIAAVRTSKRIPVSEPRGGGGPYQFK